MNKAKALKSAEELKALFQSLSSEKPVGKIRVTIPNATCSIARGSAGIIRRLEEVLKQKKLSSQVEIKVTGCRGFCQIEPVVVIEPLNVLYQRVSADDVPEIVETSLVQGQVVERLLYPVSKEKRARTEAELPFYSLQKRFVTENCGVIDPTSMKDYLLTGGYQALARALKMKPEEIINEVEKAGLRGRGGGGFNTALKWRTCRTAPGEPKYAIINADEGDPGAYMDRSLLEGDPHRVLEGLIIGAYAIGSSQGFIYVRHEYPLALRNFRTALNQAREYGFLGKNILGSGFDFEVQVNQGGGAFVCGESSALMASIEGKLGEPRAKYVHTVERGIWDKPSNLNNVETWANVPLIINKGADWFAKIGTQGSKGTKIFSVVGKINNTGLVEVPMGVTLKQIVFDIGGGIPQKKKFKAVQTGGPSGGCLPESLLSLPVDFDRLTEVGSMMGSGGMIVMDEDTCMVDVARYFLNFLKDESCGKCTPCREGIKQMLAILNRITEGKGQEGDVEQLEEMSGGIIDAALCALGGTSPNPVMSTIKYFRNEYDAHIRDHKCPAGVCKALVTYSIDPQKCTGCGLCLRNCSTGAIKGAKKKPHRINPKKCIKCGICYEVCKFAAVKRS
ncbi:MAG: 4Fe-4S binding protein [Proteobacteria bacterium]|nr:4Fe-4S binding protein [Pseudomonadota bacterium]